MTEWLSLHGLSPDRSTEVAMAHRLLRVFTAGGAAVLLLDHVTKATDERGRWAIGSERKLSGVDGAVIGFKAVEPFAPGQTGRVRLTLAKDRPGALRAIATGERRDQLGTLELVSHPDGSVTWSIGPPTDPATFRPTVLMERVSTYLEAQDAPEGLRSIRTAVKGRNDAIDTAVRTLVDEGHVERVAEGRSQLHRSLTPYRRPAEEEVGTP